MTQDSNDTKANKGGRKPKGTLQKTKDGRWRARITLGDGTRRWLAPFPAGTPERVAREKAAHYAKQAQKMDLAMSAPATPLPVDRAALKRAARESCSGWFELWLAERDQRGFSSRVTKQGHWKHHISPRRQAPETLDAGWVP